MAQHDFVIDNDTPANLRADLNLALAAIVSTNSGATAPGTTYANQFWYDENADLLKIRNEANSAWITLGKVDQASGTFEPYINGNHVTDFLDEDDMASDAASAVASQQSVKAYVDAAEAAANTYADGTATLSANGSADLPGGLQFRWGVGASTTDGAQTFSFSSAFSNACFVVMVTTSVTNGQYPLPVSASTASGFTIDRDNIVDGSYGFMFLALGY